MELLHYSDEFKVELIDSMGDDARVVQAARVSTRADDNPKGVDRLIRYLLKNKHWSPFQHVYFTFRSEIPIFLARQVMRHQSQFFNEMSLRYSEAIPRVFLPKEYYPQSPTMKQGRLDEPFDSSEQDLFRSHVKDGYLLQWAIYNNLLAGGVAKEQCREVLPVAFYTTLYSTMSLRSLIHFVQDRTAVGAQSEAQRYAHQILSLARDVTPITFRILEELNES